jgi:hypothetical protein
MKLFGHRKFFCSFLLCILMTSCGQTQKNNLLLGNWTFYKFEFKGELSDIPESEEKKAYSANFFILAG